MRSFLLAGAGILTALAAPVALSAQATSTVITPDGRVYQMTPEQQALFDAWAAERQTDYRAWPYDYQTYYWTLTPEQQGGYWALTPDQRGMAQASSA